MILSKSIRSQHGFGAVSMALILPLLLLLALGAFELFMYMRALSIVTRAAGEAGQVAASAIPSQDFNPNTFPEIANKTLVETPSGGDTAGDLATSFASHGKLYGNFDGATPFPFELPRKLNNRDSSAGNPGVMYLPTASLQACIRPLNENANYQDTCTTSTASGPAQRAFFSYQLPTPIDVDGDQREDLAFFYSNLSGADWLIYPSSGGMLYRNALIFDTTDAATVGSNAVSVPKWMPCPADYDGDGRTDICAAAVVSTSIRIWVRFSTESYARNNVISVNALGAKAIAPVPGRWEMGKPDRFGVILLDCATVSCQLATAIWPTFTRQSNVPLDPQAFTLSDNPTIFNSTLSKPPPGRLWRPAYADHDGDGVLDIGWVDWSGANPTNWLAGAGPGIDARDEAPAREALMRPWKVRLSSSGILFIVERDNHRVSAVVGSLLGELNSTAVWRRIGGIANPTVPNTPTYPLDPLLKGISDAAAVPLQTGQNGCPTCYSGGSFSTTKALANATPLNNPTDYVDFGVPGQPGFIADFGNYRVWRLIPGSTSHVKGNEQIVNEAGGDATIDCTATHGAGPIAGGASVSWTAYSSVEQQKGIHPRCVKIRPTSLELDRSSSPALFIGDASGAIFMITAGADKILNADTDATERMYLVAGNPGAFQPQIPTSNTFAASNTLGVPAALSYVSSPSKALYALIHDYPSASKPSWGYAGGIIMITPGADGKFGSADDVLTTALGDWVQSKQPTVHLALSGKLQSLRSAVDFFTVPSDPANGNGRGFFIANWYSTNTDVAAENSIVRAVYAKKDNAKNFLWLNNPHNHARGWRSPDTPTIDYATVLSNAIPFGNAPFSPGAGITGSGSTLYFSEPTKGRIFRTQLDFDGDGIPDFSDPDMDGDGISNATEGNAGNVEPAMADSIEQRSYDPRMWATGAFTKISACGNTCTTQKRIIWWFDRISRGGAPSGSTIPPEEDGFHTLFNSDTLALPNGRGALHDTPVWSGGPDRSTERRKDTGRIMAAPIIASLSTGLKDVSGYDHCTWGEDGAEFDTASINSAGVPQTKCIASTDSVDPVHIRRVHLSFWNQYSFPISSSNEISMIDWDGDGIRDAAIYANSEFQSYSSPLVVQIGPLNADQCPGTYSITELTKLDDILKAKVSSWSDGLSTQYNCQSNQPFFSLASTLVATTIVNARAEWVTAGKTSGVNYPGTVGDRLSLGVKGDGDVRGSIGPVAEAAYRVLENALTVKRRENDQLPGDAKVEIISSNTSGEVDITVRYRWGFAPFMKNFFGASGVTISSTVRRRVYNGGQSG